MAAHAEDNMLADLWSLLQQMPEYKNKTTLIVTTDHGRGDIDRNDWRHHGEKIKEADQIWIAAIGSGIPAKGEINKADQIYQSQIAATIAELLGKKFIANHPAAPAIKF
jgi:arylsulfatase A-like enzyme